MPLNFLIEKVINLNMKKWDSVEISFISSYINLAPHYEQNKPFLAQRRKQFFVNDIIARAMDSA
jgi:hypothetical protein